MRKDGAIFWKVGLIDGVSSLDCTCHEWDDVWVFVLLVKCGICACMCSTALIQVRVDDEIKRRADEAFARSGLTKPSGKTLGELGIER